MAQAIHMWQYGPPDVLQFTSTDLAPLGPHEVRFRVIAAAVNRADIEIRSGKWPIQHPQPFPYTPGLEALSEVTECGSAVTTVARGTRVITMMQRLGGIHGVRPGGYQEFVTVDADAVAVVPDTLSPFDLAALGLAAVTAYSGLARLRLQPGQTVVIHGASGGVGSVAVLLAKAQDVQVVATTSNAAKDAYLRSIGVDRIVHLREHTLTQQLGARSVDAVFDTIGGRTFAESVAVLRRGGHLCLVGAASGEQLTLLAWDLLQDLHLTGYSSENLTGTDLRTAIANIGARLASGQLRAPAYQQLPLSAAAQAHALMESGQNTGRILLVPERPDVP
jgi:NADPH:quinone reductase